MKSICFCRRLAATILIAVLSVVVFAGNNFARTIPADVGSMTQSLESSYGGGTFKPIENIVVTPSADSINQTGPYVVDFDLGCAQFVQLNYGGLGLAFPEGFNLDKIERVAVSDDNPVIGYRVSRVEQSGQTVFLHLRHFWKDGDDDHENDWCSDSFVHVSVGLCDVVNPSQPGSYQLGVVAFDKKNRIIAGPNLSEPFVIADTAQPSPPEIKILELASIAPNAPWVNTSQQFQMRCRVANLSGQDLDSVVLMLTSNGGSHIKQSLLNFPVAAMDTAEVYFDIEADSLPNVGEQFLAEVVSPSLVIHTQLDKIENVIIQTPTSLSLTHELFGVTNGVVPINSTFSMAVELASLGQSSVSDAEYSVTVDPPIIGDYPQYGTIAADKHVVFEFQSPPEDSHALITFRLTSAPVDLNTNQAAPLDTNEISFEVYFESTTGEVQVRSALIGNNLIEVNRFRNVFNLSLNNLATSSRLAISLDSVVVELFDTDLTPLDVSQTIDVSRSGFASPTGNQNCRADGNRLVCYFTDLSVPAGDSLSINFGLVLKRHDLKLLVARLDFSRLGLSYSYSSSAIGRPGLVVEEGYVHDYRLVVRGESLGESLVIERNPINPDEEPLRFSYILNVKSDVDFRVFTLTGEEVYARNIRSGSEGAVAGQENIIEWDGRNNSGQMVLNGVYLTYIQIVATGESTSEKVAVLK